MPTQVQGLGLVDDQGNKSIVVNLSNARQMTSAEYQQLTPAQRNGAIIVTDFPIPEDDSVSVTADGDTTRRDLFNWIFNHCDTTKITKDSYIVYSGNDRIYHFEDINNGTYIFAWESIRATTIEKVCLQLNSSTSTEIDWTLATTGNTKEENYSYKPANGYKYTLYYGTSSEIMNLLTDADHCMMSDGETSVESAIDTLQQNETSDYVDLTSYTQNWYTFPSDGYLVSATSDNASMTTRLRGATSNFNINSITKNGENDVIYVRKGMRAILYTSTGSVALRFYPFTS